MFKRLSLVLFAILFFTNFANAGCRDDLDWSWNKKYKGVSPMIFYEFKNKGSKYIRITKIKIYASDGDEIFNFKPTSWDFDNNRTKGFFVNPGKKSSNSKNSHKAVKYGKKAGYECKYQKPWKNDLSDIFSNTSDSVSDVFDDINPINYFDKRRKCLKRKDNAETVAIGKRIYKNCMDNN